jgi:hypothetical protein
MESWAFRQCRAALLWGAGAPSRDCSRMTSADWGQAKKLKSPWVLPEGWPLRGHGAEEEEVPLPGPESGVSAPLPRMGASRGS